MRRERSQGDGFARIITLQEALGRCEVGGRRDFEPRCLDHVRIINPRALGIEYEPGHAAAPSAGLAPSKSFLVLLPTSGLASTCFRCVLASVSCAMALWSARNCSDACPYFWSTPSGVGAAAMSSSQSLREGGEESVAA